MGPDDDNEDDPAQTPRAKGETAVKVIGQSVMAHITVIDDPLRILTPGNRTGNAVEREGDSDGEY